MKPEYVTLLTVTVSVISSISTAIITGYFSRKASTDAIDKEHRIEAEKRKINERIKLLNTYVSIIKVDYEKAIVEYSLNGMMQLDYKEFNDQIRPRIYENYYLVHERVIRHFNDVERKSAELGMVGGFDPGDLIDIAHSYTEMIKEIQIIIDKNRMTVDY